MNETSLRRVCRDGRTVEYLLTRKNVKNLNLRVRPDGSVCVSAPPRIAAARIDAFVTDNLPKILAAQERLRSLPQKNDPAVQDYADGTSLTLFGDTVTVAVRKAEKSGASFDSNIRVLTLAVRDPDSPEERRKCAEGFLLSRMAEVCAEIFASLQPLFAPYGVERPEVRVRFMKSRWGSCIPSKKTVTMNARLAAYPADVIRSVAVHEMCHFLEANHSPRFYAWMEKFEPEWRKYKEILRQ